MQLHHLITIVGLAFSQAQPALPLGLATDPDLMIKQVVTLITDPSKVVESIPGLKNLAPEAKTSPFLEGGLLSSTATSLRGVENEHWPLVLESIDGYYHHAANNEKRAEIYRNSMYSRIIDLAKSHPEHFHSHIRKTYDDLLSKLLKLQAPDKKALKEFKEFFDQLEKKDPHALQEWYRTAMNQLPLTPNPKMVYLSPAAVNEALLKTNSVPGYPALLVNGAHFRALANHEHPQSPVAHISQTIPTSATHAPQPVAVSA